MNAGVVTLTRGPAWTSDVARGTGAGTTQITRVLGFYTNTVAITNGPGAGLGTYVGTVRSNGTATIDMIFGAVGANGTAAVIGVWNAFNRTDMSGLVGDSTDSWNYNTATWRPANNSTTMRASIVSGLQEDFATADFISFFTNTATSNSAVGVGYDVTNAASGVIQPGSANSTVGYGTACGHYSTQMLGFHFFQAVETCTTNTGTNTFYGDGGTPADSQSGLTFNWKC